MAARRHGLGVHFGVDPLYHASPSTRSLPDPVNKLAQQDSEEGGKIAITLADPAASSVLAQLAASSATGNGGRADSPPLGLPPAAATAAPGAASAALLDQDLVAAAAAVAVCAAPDSPERERVGRTSAGTPGARRHLHPEPGVVSEAEGDEPVLGLAGIGSIGSLGLSGMGPDDGCGRSHDDSDADGPMAGLGPRRGSGLRDGGGAGGPGAGAGGVGVGASGRRHGHGHRAFSGRPKTSKSSKAQNAAVMRTWLKVERGGETSILQADKWRITHKLGIQTRDLRLLDPNLSTTYPSAILCREKAIVINLEHLKAIITTNFVLVVNPEDEKVLRFIEELKMRLAAPTLPAAAGGGLPQTRSYQALSEAERLKFASSPSSLGLELPFELKALEVCLDVVASHLDFLTQELEASAYPALDALASKVSSPHLERVRRIKNNLVRLTTRVETVREVLEKFLDDDSDMHDLNLTAKELHEQEEMRAAQEAATMAEARSTVSTTGSRSDSSSSRSSDSSDSSVEEAETAMVEMLLETYFMHVDNTYNKLQTLHEYIGDTEDLVNIKLDQHRNQLITIDLMLTGITTVVACMTSVGGWFGMNLHNGMEEMEGKWLQVVLTTCILGILVLVAFVVALWRSKLLIT